MSDEIEIDLKSDVSDGEKARKKLAEIDAEIKDLTSSFNAGGVGLDRYNQRMKALESQANRTRTAIEKIPDAGGKLTGTARAGAISRGALLGANTLQDVIQGGPASGINNILGAANDQGIKALAGEALAAAGGFRVVATALGTVAAAGASAFLILDEGLKDNKLGWSDLGSVINAMAGGAFTTLGQNSNSTLGSIHDTVASIVGGIADVTIGWNAAADEVNRVKANTDLAAESLREYLKAQKQLGGVKSDVQVKSEAHGKRFVDELADMGGAGGLGGMIARMAKAETLKTGDQLMKMPVLDAEGKDTGKTEDVSRRELARRRITRDVAMAQNGDVHAQNRIKQQVTTMGVVDPDRLDHGEQRDRQAQQTNDELDLAQQEKKDRKERAAKIQADEAERVNAEIDQDQAAKKANAQEKLKGTGLDQRAENALLRANLANGGTNAAAAEASLAAMISRELQARGVDKLTANTVGAEKARESATALSAKVADKQLNPDQKIEHVSAADFARSAEAAGSEKLLDVNNKMLDKLTDMVTAQRQGPRMGR